jgi:hypothetical protein
MRLGHDVGDGGVELAALFDRTLNRFKNVFRQRRFHLVQRKHIAGPEVLQGFNRSGWYRPPVEDVGDGIEAGLGRHPTRLGNGFTQLQHGAGPLS